MKLYTCTDFSGHWPVGTAAVVIAPDKATAKQLLETALTQAGLPQTIEEASVVQQSMGTARAIILRDGNY